MDNNLDSTGQAPVLNSSNLNPQMGQVGSGAVPQFSSTQLSGTKARSDTQYFTNVQKASLGQRLSEWLSKINRNSAEKSRERREAQKAKREARRRAAELAAFSAAVPNITLPQKPNSRLNPALRIAAQRAAGNNTANSGAAANGNTGNNEPKNVVVEASSAGAAERNQAVTRVPAQTVVQSQVAAQAPDQAVTQAMETPVVAAPNTTVAEPPAVAEAPVAPMVETPEATMPAAAAMPVVGTPEVRTPEVVMPDSSDYILGAEEATGAETYYDPGVPSFARQGLGTARLPEAGTVATRQMSDGGVAPGSANGGGATEQGPSPAGAGQPTVETDRLMEEVERSMIEAEQAMAEAALARGKSDDMLLSSSMPLTALLIISIILLIAAIILVAIWPWG